MKRISPQDSWPESWKYSYPYDLMEIYGDKSIPGYTYAYQNRSGAALNLIQKYLPVKGNIKMLDIAGAQGNFSLRMAEMGYHVTWNDLRDDLVDYVELKREKGTIDYKPGNVFDLGFNEYFDGILMTEIIEHVAHPDEFLQKVSSMVKKGGYIFMTTPLGNYFLNKLPKFSDCKDASVYESMQFKPNSDGHIFLLHVDEVYQLSKKVGLDILEIKVCNNPLTSGHIKLGKVLKGLPKNIVSGIERFSQKFPKALRYKLHSNIAVVLKKS